MTQDRKKNQTILFDLGDTLIHQKVDSETTLDRLELKLLPRILEILDCVSHRYDLGIITNTETSNEGTIWRCLQKLGIKKYFRTVTTSVDVEVKKPGEEIFWAALSKHTRAPKSTIMIGNNYYEDIVPAKELGMITVYLKHHEKTEGQLFQSADYIVRNTNELLKLFHDGAENHGLSPTQD